MDELEPGAYFSASALFDPLSEHLAVPAVLEGRAAGRVFLDHLNQPQNGLIWTGYRIFLAGAGGPAFLEQLREFFTASLRPALGQAGATAFMLSSSLSLTDPQVAATFAGLRVIRAPRQYYRHLATDPLPSARLPEGFALRFVEAGLPGRADLKGLDWLLEEMCSERPSVEEFLAHSFGVYLEHAGEIAGWCLSEYNCSQGCEIGIATAEAYQRQGLATAMTAAFVEYAHRCGNSQVGWDCFAENLPSAATARKAGFRKISDYNAHLVLLNQQQGE